MDKSKSPNPERLTPTYSNGNYPQMAGNIFINVSNCNVVGNSVINVTTNAFGIGLSLIKAQQETIDRLNETIDRLLSIIEKQTTMISGGQGNG